MNLLLLAVTVALALLVLVLAALFSALEAALLFLRDHHFEYLQRRAPELGGIIARFRLRPRRSANQAVLMSTVLTLLLAVCGLLLSRQLQPFWPEHPVVLLGIVFAVLIVVGDLLPKLVAISSPERVFRLAGKPFHAVSWIVTGFSDRATRFMDGLLGRLFSEARSNDGFTDEELETLIEMRCEQGSLTKTEGDILQEILHLGDETVSYSMTPRVEVVMVPEDIGDEDLRQRLRSGTHWRVPVYRETPDQVIGVLDVRKWLRHPALSLRECTEPPVFIPESMKLLEAFRAVVHKPRDIAVVLDEYGGVAGVLSWADVMEELLDEVAPERGAGEDLVAVGPNRVLVHGDMRLEDLDERLGTRFGTGPSHVETIGGLVFLEAGRLPSPGTRLTLGEVPVTVRRCRGRRIVDLILQVPLPEGFTIQGEAVGDGAVPGEPVKLGGPPA